MTAKVDYDVVKSYFESQGYELLETEYKSNKHQMKVKCPNGHISFKTWTNFKTAGQRCAICKKNQKFTYEEVRKMCLDSGFVLLSQEYVKCADPLELYCIKCKTISNRISLNMIRKGQGCGNCYATRQGERSEFEMSVKEWIEKWFDKSLIEYNDRTQLTNPETGKQLELDVWIPSCNKAIEIQGKYHNQPLMRERDAKKAQLCEDRGIRLLAVGYSEWNRDNNGGIKRKIIEFLK